MSLSGKSYQDLFSFLIIITILILPGKIFSQVTLKGRVIYKIGSTPAVSASVKVLNKKGAETMTNSTGNFALHISDSQSTDTVVISSVGYQSIILPVSAALKRSEFILSEIVKDLESVTVFNTHQVVGSISESVGFYRSWSNNTGGEIGRIFTLPYDKFKIDKIRFKAGNLCDTCLLRLHIREVDKGLPGDEILNDSISLVINKLSLDSKIPEFDLTPYNITFTENEFFVGIEVLNCTGNKKESSCSFSFAGTDKGEYIYKTRANKDWETATEYTIYLKLFLRY